MTVYDGEKHVLASLDSAARLKRFEPSLDILVLDDCSPAPGWSERLRTLCAERGVRYYRTPRNLGIPRNVNLALLTCVNEGYDEVIVANSDVLLPSNLIEEMRRAADQPGVGSVTAWSNNVSIYSLPCEAPDIHLASQDAVDWLSATLAGNFSGSVMDIPAGISFCILIRRHVIDKVGLMDPVYGRGYCEETDWSLRSLALGFRIALAPSVFVYHEGGGSNVQAGLLRPGETTVAANEAIIDLRYPQFRAQVDSFGASGVLQTAWREAARVVLQSAGRQYGYMVEASWLKRPMTDFEIPRVLVAPDGVADHAVAEFLGIEARIEVDPADIRGSVESFFQCAPTAFSALDHGGLRDSFAGIPISDSGPVYPSRV
jgi:GT2 family glycosyltransferase